MSSLEDAYICTHIIRYAWYFFQYSSIIPDGVRNTSLCLTGMSEFYIFVLFTSVGTTRGQRVFKVVVDIYFVVIVDAAAFF